MRAATDADLIYHHSDRLKSFFNYQQEAVVYSSPNGKEKPEVYRQEHLLQGGFLIDMDGVIYHNSRLIPGADRFANSLIQNEIPFLFCTNNSQRIRRDLVMKLKQLGIDVKERNIFTSAMATARFLAAQNPQGTASSGTPA
jgi:hypothetical protein